MLTAKSVFNNKDECLIEHLTHTYILKNILNLLRDYQEHITTQAARYGWLHPTVDTSQPMRILDISL